MTKLTQNYVIVFFESNYVDGGLVTRKVLADENSGPASPRGMDEASCAAPLSEEPRLHRGRNERQDRDQRLKKTGAERS